MLFPKASKTTILLLCALLTAFWTAYPAGAVVREQWNRRWNGPANLSDSAAKVAVDAAGNVYVAGSSDGGSSHGSDYRIVKYAPDGTELWTRRYDGSAHANDYINAIALDTAGNVYVTGGATYSDTGVDFATIKYDTYGNRIWLRTFDGPRPYGDISDDSAIGIAVDSAGNVCVTGTASDNGSGIYIYMTVKYDSFGNQLWAQAYTPSNYNFAGAVGVDSAGNVYVTGSSNDRYLTIKYDPNGNPLWVQRYHQFGDAANSIAVDGAGNVCVTGTIKVDHSEGASSHLIATVKYDTNGNQLWDSWEGGDHSFGVAVAEDSSGNAYLTAKTGSYLIGSNDDYLTIKYNPAGAEVWRNLYNGPADLNDQPSAIAVDSVGNVYVTGSSASGSHIDFATVKYSSTGAQHWVRRFNGPARLNDSPFALALDSFGSVYVAGTSDDGVTGTDFRTVKYAQFP